MKHDLRAVWHLQATHHIFLQFLGWRSNSCGLSLMKPELLLFPPRWKGNLLPSHKRKRAVDRFGENCCPTNYSVTISSEVMWPVRVHEDGTILLESDQELGNGNFQNFSVWSNEFKRKWPDHSTCQTVTSYQAGLGILTTYPPGLCIPPSLPTFITFCHCCATLPSQGFKVKSAVLDVRHSPTPWVATIGKS